MGITYHGLPNNTSLPFPYTKLYRVKGTYEAVQYIDNIQPLLGVLNTVFTDTDGSVYIGSNRNPSKCIHPGSFVVKNPKDDIKIFSQKQFEEKFEELF